MQFNSFVYQLLIVICLCLPVYPLLFFFFINTIHYIYVKVNKVKYVAILDTYLLCTHSFRQY